jgi:hypothetical protein
VEIEPSVETLRVTNVAKHPILGQLAAACRRPAKTRLGSNAMEFLSRTSGLRMRRHSIQLLIRGYSSEGRST